MADKSNVLEFRAKGPIFNPDLRKRLEEGVGSHTEKPAEVVTTVEQILCSYIVQIARRWATNLAEKAGKKVAQRLSL